MKKTQRELKPKISLTAFRINLRNMFEGPALLVAQEELPQEEPPVQYQYGIPAQEQHYKPFNPIQHEILCGAEAQR